MGSLLGSLFSGGYGNFGGSTVMPGMTGQGAQQLFPAEPQQRGGNYGDLFQQWIMPQRPQGYAYGVPQTGQAGMGGGRTIQPSQQPLENTAQQPQPDSQGRASLLWDQPTGNDVLTGRTGLIR